MNRVGTAGHLGTALGLSSRGSAPRLWLGGQRSAKAAGGLTRHTIASKEKRKLHVRPTTAQQARGAALAVNKTVTQEDSVRDRSQKARGSGLSQANLSSALTHTQLHSSRASPAGLGKARASKQARDLLYMSNAGTTDGALDGVSQLRETGPTTLGPAPPRPLDAREAASSRGIFSASAVRSTQSVARKQESAVSTSTGGPFATNPRRGPK